MSLAFRLIAVEQAHLANPANDQNKQVSCINAPYAPIDLPSVSDKLNYEAEPGLDIGTGRRHIPRDDALSHTSGHFVVNGVSVRDWQPRWPTFTRGKCFDRHGPIGPWITTAEEIADPQALELVLTVSGEERPRSSTRYMIYSIADQIAHPSTVMTLEPGDLIATATPSMSASRAIASSTP